MTRKTSVITHSHGPQIQHDMIMTWDIMGLSMAFPLALRNLCHPNKTNMPRKCLPDLGPTLEPQISTKQSAYTQPRSPRAKNSSRPGLWSAGSVLRIFTSLQVSRRHSWIWRKKIATDLATNQVPGPANESNPITSPWKKCIQCCLRLLSWVYIERAVVISPSGAMPW